MVCVNAQVDLLAWALAKHTETWLLLGTRCPRSQLRIIMKRRQGFLKVRLDLADAVWLKVSSPRSTGVWPGPLSRAGLESRDGAGIMTERRSLSGSTQQEPRPTYYISSHDSQFISMT